MGDEFVCELDVFPDDLIAAVEAGRLVRWRADASGTQWFRRAGPSMIHAVPADRLTADDGGDDDVLADDSYSDEEPQLDDFERALLQRWADELRRGAADQDDGDANDD
jgi:hypothetical protein